AEGQEPAAPAAEPPPAPSGQRGWIISPAIDLLCVGGLSLLVLLPWVLLRRRITIGQIALLSVLINMPHFLASYVLLYRNKEQVLRYKLASIGVPLALLAYSVFAVASASHTNVHVANFAAFAGLYLAWHYTGQTWGMIATFGYLSGRPFDGLEGQLVRGGLRVLLVWHVCWFLYVGRAPFFPPWLQASIDQAYAILSVVAGASLVLG
ncbi:MAG TPA: hypothetical protein DEA08_23105, partial [Planctomycetes bacterium]|nr:hypothetical protein [Planctomycetota bacterium]